MQVFLNIYLNSMHRTDNTRWRGACYEYVMRWRTRIGHKSRPYEAYITDRQQVTLWLRNVGVWIGLSWLVMGLWIMKVYKI